MQSNSSTALAITSILTILIVFFLTISDVENAPLRKPFPSAGADLPNSIKLEAEKEDNSKVDKQESDRQMDTISEDDKKLAEMIALTEEDKKYLEVSLPDAETIMERTAQGEKSQVPPLKAEELLVKNINNELLNKVGYRNFVVKPKPFNGELFNAFDLSMLGHLDIVEKIVTELRDGNEKEVLRIYEFDFAESNSGAQETYDFLKAKIKGELGVLLNETNQFGLSSFYINFATPQEKAFLVVKTRTNVYALSYPKGMNGDKTYFELTSKLLLELI